MEADSALFLGVCVDFIKKKKKRDRKSKSVWVRDWIKRRPANGAYHALLKELEVEDPRSFSNFLRMDRGRFDHLLEKVSEKIQRRDTILRESLQAGEMLAVTLRYLATGDSYQSLEYLYRIPKNSICQFIPRVCQAIYHALKDDYLKVPSTADEWLAIEAEFYERWNFPHCIGALDGKHVSIRAPAHSGSDFYNYKKFFSIILLALVDAHCRFIFVDVGANGRAGDAAVYTNSNLHQHLEAQTLNIPPPSPLEGRHEPVPRVIVGDDAFALKTSLMKPYSSREQSFEKRIFNYRLSRARRVSENAFGLLGAKFRIFSKPLQVSYAVGVDVILACIALHNYLKAAEPVFSNEPAASNIFDNIERNGGNHNSQRARDVRDEFADYFMTNGQVEWQWTMAL